MKRYFLVWLKLISNTIQNAFASWTAVIFFTFGKITRFAVFLIFLLLLVQKTSVIAGYSLWEVILFYLTFTLIDILSQGLFREVYRFRFYVISGNFDHFLLKPFSPLFRTLLGGLDILDMMTLIPLLIFIVVDFIHLPHISFISFLFYLLLVINGILIAVSFHIFVLGLGVIAFEVDNAIWIFRDLTYNGRVPIDIYREPLRGILTFILPVAVMINFPAKALLGVLSYPNIVMAAGFSCGLITLSILFWKFALKRYTSASS